MPVEATIHRDGDQPTHRAGAAFDAIAVDPQPALALARILIGYARCSTERQTSPRNASPCATSASLMIGCISITG
jgi:hypothetical protein